MKKLLLIGTAALLSTTALAQDSKGWWTYEELSAGVKKYEYSRQVLAGKKIELGNWGSMKPDCSPRRYGVEGDERAGTWDCGIFPINRPIKLPPGQSPF